MRLHPVSLVVASLGTGHAQIHEDKRMALLDYMVARADTTAAPAATTLITAPPTSTSTSSVPTHTIAVGATGFNFTPDNLTVAVGSIIEFNFYPGNHSVVRSAFKFPCIPYEETGPNRVGFFSGFLDTNVYSSDGPKYRVRVNDSEPIFYYCSAPGSCITHGMIGVINPNATWTLETQEEYAANTTIQLTPGDPLPSEMAPTTVALTSTTATATNKPSSSSSSSSSPSGLSGGAIAGIIIGVLAGIALLAATVVFCCLRFNPRWQQQQQRRLARFGGRRFPPRGSADMDGDGTSGNSAMLSPISPNGGVGHREDTPASAYRRHDRKYGSNSGPGLGAGPGMTGMTDMGGYFGIVNTLTADDYRHRTPPVPPVPRVPQVPAGVHPYSATPTMMSHSHGHGHGHMQFQGHPHPHTYVPGLPIYNSMATMPARALSPLQSHPTSFSTASPFPDKDAYYPTPPVPSPPPRPPPLVELPTAVSASAEAAAAAAAAASSSSADNRLRVSPPPALKESPVIGGMEGTWGNEAEESAELTKI